jgi:hypothetical protein
MSDHQLDLTPYERFLRDSLEDEKRKLAELSEKFAKAGPIRKKQIKRQLDTVNQNIQLISTDLKNYESGLRWLRELSKERDEIAERLKPVPIEAILAQAPKAATPALGAKPSAPAVGARPPGAAPAVGRPLVGQPVGSTIQTGGGVQPPSGSSQQQAPRIGTPTVGKPVGTFVGRPGANPETSRPSSPQTTAQDQQNQKEQQATKEGETASGESKQSQPSSRISAVMGKPGASPTTQAPRVGTPIGSQTQEPKNEQKEEKEKSTQKESESFTTEDAGQKVQSEESGQQNNSADES